MVKPAAKRLVFIVGPTAAGKSETAFRLAKKINGEIISCDSMQVYRRMPITSQVPPPKWREAIPHYLIEELEPTKEYSAAEFRKKSLRLIESILKQKKTPIIAGGTGLYMKALLDGLFLSPKKDTALRKKLQKEAKSKSPQSLYSKLEEIDPETAAKIHPNDIRRIIRALEVYYLTGVSISRQKKRAVGITSKYDCLIFGLNMPREALYKKIDDRVESMFDAGIVKEIKKIYKKKLSMTARASLGYKEIIGYLKKEYSLLEAKELLKRNTRRLAKKQLTWFRADKRIKWLDVDEKGIGTIVDEIYGKSDFSSS